MGKIGIQQCSNTKRIENRTITHRAKVAKKTYKCNKK